MINLNNDFYKMKYIKYKNKYITIKNQYGGVSFPYWPPSPELINLDGNMDILEQMTSVTFQYRELNEKDAHDLEHMINLTKLTFYLITFNAAFASKIEYIIKKLTKLKTFVFRPAHKYKKPDIHIPILLSNLTNMVGLTELNIQIGDLIYSSSSRYPSSRSSSVVLLNPYNNNETLKKPYEEKLNNQTKNTLKTLLFNIRFMTKLKILNLSRNNIDNDGAKILGDSLAQIIELEYLDLSYNDIYDEGFAPLIYNGFFYNGTFKMKQLIHLNLSENYIAQEGAKAIAESFPYLSKITYLNLSTNNIGDEGATYLASTLAYIVNLQTLDLSLNNIGDEGAKYLASSLKRMTQLRYLNLSRNNIGDKGTKALKDSISSIPGLKYEAPSIPGLKYKPPQYICIPNSTGLYKTLKDCKERKDV
jgi:hypothetical protein